MLAMVMVLYLLFLIWIRSWWGLIVVPFIFDAYITKIIPWGFWHEWENDTARGIMSWVDAIVFALVAVYFVNLYIFQNYQIPSSSLEKSLLVGDYLFVSKASYGPRVPNTPLSLQLTQHTIPGTNMKSYIDWPQWKYKRVTPKPIQLNDIVVFNYPAGDTIVSEVRYQTEYYAMCYGIGTQLYQQQTGTVPQPEDLTPLQQRQYYSTVYELGRQYIRLNSQDFGEVGWRPVDRRENYVKRCIGLPGQTLEIRDKVVYLDG
jgi:signal peptidase I